MSKHYRNSFAELEKWRDALRSTASPQELILAIEDRIRDELDPERQDILNTLLVQEHHKQGNEAAVAAIRAKDPREEIHYWYFESRRTSRDKSIIPVLEERLRSETHPLKIEMLRHHLAAEYTNSWDYESAESIHLGDFNADPDNALPLISLAYQKLESEHQSEAAMRIINQALEVAARSGDFRRLALGMQARIALRLEDFRLVEDVLKQLLDLKFTRGNADINVERDFLDALPPGSIDPDVARRYDEYCRMRGKPPGADTPKGRPPEGEAS